MSPRSSVLLHGCGCADARRRRRRRRARRRRSRRRRPSRRALRMQGGLWASGGRSVGGRVCVVCVREGGGIARRIRTAEHPCKTEPARTPRPFCSLFSDDLLESVRCVSDVYKEQRRAGRCACIWVFVDFSPGPAPRVCCASEVHRESRGAAAGARWPLPLASRFSNK